MFIIKDGTTGGEGTTAEIIQQIEDYLRTQNKIIRTKDQDSAVIAQAVKDANAGRKIDATLKEVTGIDRNENETEEAYVKRSVAKKLEEITTLKTKIKEYEDKGAEGSVLATEYKQRLEILQEEFKLYKKTSEENLSNLKTQTFQTRVDNEIAIAVSKIPLRKMDDNPEINAKLQDQLRRAQIQEFKSNYTAADVEGMIVFKDKSGHVVRKTSDATPEGIDAIIKPMFDHLIEKGHQQPGTGSGAPGGAGAGGEGGKGNEGKTDWSKESLPKEVTSQTQLTNYLKNTKKLDVNSKEFSDAFTALNAKGEGGRLPVTPKAA